MVAELVEVPRPGVKMTIRNKRRVIRFDLSLEIYRRNKSWLKTAILESKRRTHVKIEVGRLKPVFLSFKQPDRVIQQGRSSGRSVSGHNHFGLRISGFHFFDGG